MTSAAGLPLDITEGSSLYYGLRFLPSSKKTLLLPYVAFAQMAQNFLSHLKSTEVALMKLQWWIEELRRLEKGEAQHPITRALDKTMKKQRIGILQNYLMTLSEKILQPGIRDQQHLASYSRQTEGQLLQIIAEDCLLLSSEPPTAALPESRKNCYLSLAYSLTQCQHVIAVVLQQLPARYYLPNLMGEPTKEAVFAALGTMVSNADLAYHQARECFFLDVDNLRPLSPLFNYVYLQCQSVKKLRRYSFKPKYFRDAHLMPIYSCWKSWRARYEG